ncbi:MAG: hemolysin III family protein, partial [Spirochaetaceae bacterium]|nr:hemolysin III family protein [Spirochaetaceae bacterium]
LAMGWIVAFLLPELRAASSPTSVALLLAGGICYSLGALVYLLERIPWFHALWHLFVLGGAGCHIFAVLALLNR